MTEIAGFHAGIDVVNKPPDHLVDLGRRSHADFERVAEARAKRLSLRALRYQSLGRKTVTRTGCVEILSSPEANQGRDHRQHIRGFLRQSQRSADCGSMRVARRAGSQLAAAAIATRITATAAKVPGSRGLISNRKLGHTAVTAGA